VSQALTGAPEVPRKRRLAGEYLERFAQLWDPTKTDIPNPGYFPKLLALHDRYKNLPDAPPDAKAAQLIDDPNFTDAAQQVLYLWYVSAFFIEPPGRSIPPIIAVAAPARTPTGDAAAGRRARILGHCGKAIRGMRSEREAPYVAQSHDRAL